MNYSRPEHSKQLPVSIRQFMPPTRLLHRPALLLLLLPGLVYAQLSAPPAPAASDAKPDTPATPPAAAAPVQRVEVKGTVYNERRQDTASKTVISHEEIIRFGDTSLSDVLKRLPGVSIAGGGIRFRGLGNGYTQVLLNGEPAPPGFQIDNLTPDSIEKIEIVRAATAEFSTQSIAGTINIVTKKVVQTAQREIKLSHGVDAGKPSTFFNANRSDKIGNFSYTFNGSLFHGNFGQPSENSMQDFDAAGQQTAFNQTRHQFDGFYEGFNLNPRLNWKLANGDTVSLNSFVRINRSGNTYSDTVLRAVGEQLPNLNNNGKFNARTSNFNSNLNWLHSLAEGGKLDIKLSYNYSQRDTNSLFDGTDLAFRPQLERRNHTLSIDSGVTSTGKYSRTTAKDHTLVFGWDGAFSEKREARQQLDSLPPGGDLNHFTPINLDDHFLVKVSRAALFGQDEWSLTPAWSLYLGLRFEAVQTDSSGSAVASNSNRFHVVSPIVQTLWKLPNTKDSQLRLALSRTYKAPSVGSLNARRTISTENSPTRPDSQGNPNLRPELAWGLDLGLEHFLSEGGLFSINSYIRKIDDVNGTALFLQDGRYVSQPVNQGKALSRGLELEAKFPLRAFWKAAPAIELRANLNKSWSHIDTIPGPDNRLDGQTPLSANVGLDYKLDKLMLGGNFSWQNNGNLRTSSTQTIYTSVTRTLDMYALWKFDKQDQIRLSFNNLLHQGSFTQSRYADANGSQLQNRSNPDSVNIRLGLEHKF
jgi:outer membrane receptor protein involved in Fe transport